jgi:hypothetical protein
MLAISRPETIGDVVAPVKLSRANGAGSILAPSRAVGSTRRKQTCGRAPIANNTNARLRPG